MRYIMLYVTHPNMEHAKQISEELIHRKLVACVNYFPISVTFHWENHVNSWEEIVTIYKTRKENWDIVRLEIEKMHSYEILCITKIDVEANNLYVEWVEKVTNKHIS